MQSLCLKDLKQNVKEKVREKCSLIEKQKGSHDIVGL